MPAKYVVVALSILFIAGCGTQTTIKTVTTPPSPGTTSTAPTSTGDTGTVPTTGDTGTVPTTPGPAQIGDTITLSGMDNQMDVTMLKVIDPVAASQFDTPPNGQKLVGIEFKMKNVGTNAYGDSPDNGAELILRDDTQADTTITTDPPCDSPGHWNIAPGATRQGCLAFQVPTGAQPKTVQLTLDSGMADQTGEWTVN